MVYLWRAVDAEGRGSGYAGPIQANKHAALKLMRKLLRKYAIVPERLVTDDLRSYGQRPSISASTTCGRRPARRCEEREDPVGDFAA